MLWPDFCIAGTPGAEIYPDILVRGSDIIVKCGTDPTIDNCILYIYYK